MDKICIVKLRKNMTGPAAIGQNCGRGNREGDRQPVLGSSSPAAEDRGVSGALDQNKAADGEKEVADSTVSLLLTPEQVRVLQLNTNLSGCLNGAAAKGFAAATLLDEAIVLKIAFEPLPPVRLLKVEEVIHMLRISRGCLIKIIRRGELKSYKLGRLRRIKFDDVLSYLESSQEFTNFRQRASIAKVSQSSIV
jgi:excisionase family DNA binding protein